MNTRASLVLISLAVVSSGRLHAQSTGAIPKLEWGKQFGASENDWSRGVSADGLGNVYLTGFTYGELVGVNAGERDAYLVKYDSSGALIWTRQFGTSSFDVSTAVSADRLGNIYVSGVTGGHLGGPLVGWGDVFIAKFDDSGELIWTRQLGTTHWETSYGMAADGLGNIYISGYTLGDLAGANSGDGDAFVSKYDDSGALLWTRLHGSSVWDVSNGVTIDSAGDVYIAGVTGDFLGGNAGEKDAFVAKYDADGTLLWSKQFGTVDDDEITGVSSDGSGGIYIVGHTTGSLAGTNAGNEDIFVRKYDGSGEHLWTRQWGAGGSDISRGISVDAVGNTYVTGTTHIRVGVSLDAFVIKHDPHGTLRWSTQLGTPRSTDQGYAVSADGPGGVYISGITNGDFYGASAGKVDVFIARLTDPVPESSSLMLCLIVMTTLLTRKRWPLATV